MENLNFIQIIMENGVNMSTVKHGLFSSSALHGLFWVDKKGER